MIVVFLVAGVPVYRLTRLAGVTEAVVDTRSAAISPGVNPAPLEVEAVFAPAPEDFQIKNLGQPVLTGHGPQARFTGRWAANLPPEGLDLVVQAHWAASTVAGAPPGTPPGVGPAAARVTVRFADGRQVEKSFWAAANGALNDVFTVPGETPAATP